MEASYFKISIIISNELSKGKYVDIVNLLKVSNQKDLRNWFEINHLKEKTFWLKVTVKETPDTISYLDAVETALCFGWIDSTKKKNASGETLQRFSPRGKNSNWTELNKERVRRLQKLNLMHLSGLKITPNLQEEFVINEKILIKLKEDETVYENFLAFPELYQRIRIDTIQTYQKEINVFNFRLNKFILNTRQNIMFGQWNDNGRLLNY